MAFHKTRFDAPYPQNSTDERNIAADEKNWIRALKWLGPASSKSQRLGMLKRFGYRFINVVRREGPSVAIEKGVRKLRKKMAVSRLSWVFRNGCAYFTPGPKSAPYEIWRGFNGRNHRRSHRLAQVPRDIRFSIIVPVYNPPLDVFRAMIESVLAQSYDRWELVLVDDASPDPRVRPELEAWAKRDARIKVSFRSKNGNISAATNQAADEASGDFFILLDNDDLLHSDALAHLASHIEENPGTDLIYSDDDKIGEDGRHHSEQFKPGWSPELLLAFCYTGHITAVRAGLYRALGGMRVGFEGSQDHDFWLRASEKAEKIGHVPQILYHWRVLPGSTAASGASKPASFEAGRRAVEEAFHRRGIPCSVKQTEWAVRNACSIFEPIMPDDGPSVAILIPTRNQAKRLKLIIDCLLYTSPSPRD